MGLATASGMASGEAPGLPLGLLEHPRDATRAPSPLRALELPEPVSAPRSVVSVRRLDAGRLYVPGLVEAAGWGTGIPLAADLSESNRARLTPATGTKSPHVDKAGRIVVPSGLRDSLGLADGEHLVAWTTGDGVVHLAPADVLPAVFAAFDRGACGRVDPEEGATVHYVDRARARRGSSHRV
jgi:AbrB family looped-hinge helix DNA binding protein